MSQLTREDLNPSADHVDSRRAHEQEQQHATNTDQNQEGRESDEERRGFERRAENRVEVVESAVANELLPCLIQLAVLEQAEIAGAGAAGRVTDPMRLDEDHDVDDGEADGEDAPHDTNGARVTHIVDVVNSRRLRILDGFLGIHLVVFAYNRR